MSHLSHHQSCNHSWEKLPKLRQDLDIITRILPSAYSSGCWKVSNAVSLSRVFVGGEGSKKNSASHIVDKAVKDVFPNWSSFSTPEWIKSFSLEFCRRMQFLIKIYLNFLFLANNINLFTSRKLPCFVKNLRREEKFSLFCLAIKIVFLFLCKVPNDFFFHESFHMAVGLSWLSLLLKSFLLVWDVEQHVD